MNSSSPLPAAAGTSTQTLRPALRWALAATVLAVAWVLVQPADPEPGPESTAASGRTPGLDRHAAPRPGLAERGSLAAVRTGAGAPAVPLAWPPGPRPRQQGFATGSASQRLAWGAAPTTPAPAAAAVAMAQHAPTPLPPPPWRLVGQLQDLQGLKATLVSTSSGAASGTAPATSAQGEQTRVVGAGDAVDGSWQVAAVQPGTVLLRRVAVPSAAAAAAADPIDPTYLLRLPEAHPAR